MSHVPLVRITASHEHLSANRGSDHPYSTPHSSFGVTRSSIDTWKPLSIPERLELIVNYTMALGHCGNKAEVYARANVYLRAKSVPGAISPTVT